MELVSPSLSVRGVGPIALPLLPEQAAQLAAVAEQAPFLAKAHFPDQYGPLNTLGSYDLHFGARRHATRS
jgi:hypothetical protein